jgi:hypothetical protein
MTTFDLQAHSALRILTITAPYSRSILQYLLSGLRRDLIHGHHGTRTWKQPWLTFSMCGIEACGSRSYTKQSPISKTHSGATSDISDNLERLSQSRQSTSSGRSKATNATTNTLMSEEDHSGPGEWAAELVLVPLRLFGTAHCGVWKVRDG